MTATDFLAVGLDHTTAGIEVRERVAFADAEIPAALARLTDPAKGLLEQAAILSTCNRVELYGVSRSRSAERWLASFLANRHGLDASQVTSMLYIHRDDHVPHHLAATAARMNSLVLGEAQIQGQIRKALEHAVSAGTAGPELRRLFESAIAAGRRVRSRTAIGRGATSIPYAGVEFARQRLGTLTHSTVLLIRTGETAQLAAKQLVKREAKQLLVLGRTASHTTRLAQSNAAHAITFDQLDEAFARSDVVITATGAPQPIVHRDRLRRALARRDVQSTPLLLIDLSVPRDVDPAVTELPTVELPTIDDLRGAVDRALRQRRAELPEANRLLRSEVARFTTWLKLTGVRRRESSRSGRG
jgi:glutamyl-tRNA reductase